MFLKEKLIFYTGAKIDKLMKNYFKNRPKYF